MGEIKFRQAIYLKGVFHRWHYWGFIEQYGNLTFVGAETNLSSVQEALKNSQRFIGIKDRDEIELYEGDIVEAEVEVSLVTVGSPVVIGSIEYSTETACWHCVESKESSYPLYSLENLRLLGNICEDPGILDT